ncbi:MAG: DUF4292 domain-containing protein [Ignavibacteriales bacterium]|nr:MAG: DUF4292 domain-containing protein [Ignavibacteriales bacterium]
MSKIKILLIISLLASACSVSRRSVLVYKESEVDKLTLFDRIREKNISGTDFNIKKAEIEVNNNDQKQKLLANLKYKNPGIYLLSIRSKTGIEAARVYITTDTILVNDRINKRLFYGSTSFLERKYGISAEALPLVFGDFIFGLQNENGENRCEEGEKQFQTSFKERSVEGIIDCKRNKIISNKMGDVLGGNAINFTYSDFNYSGRLIFPMKIRIEDIEEKTIINVAIKSIEFVKNESIEFIPGSKYDKVLLK